MPSAEIIMMSVFLVTVFLLIYEQDSTPIL